MICQHCGKTDIPDHGMHVCIGVLESMSLGMFAVPEAILNPPNCKCTLGAIGLKGVDSWCNSWFESIIPSRPPLRDLIPDGPITVPEDLEWRLYSCFDSTQPWMDEHHIEGLNGQATHEGSEGA